MRLLLDEMWPPAVAAALRERGHEVVAVAERADLRGQPDEVVFATAQSERRAVVTENVSDFRPLAAQTVSAGRAYFGLILTSNRGYPRADHRTAMRLRSALDALLEATPGDIGHEVWLP